MTITNIKGLTLVITLILITTFAGCKKSTYYQLTEEEMTWLAYENNEVLKFLNSNGERLVYYVTLRSKAYNKDGDTYSEFTQAHFQQLNDTTALYAQDTQGVLFINKSSDGFKVTFSWPHFALKEVPLTNIFPAPATIGGIIYNDVYKLDAAGLTDLRNYNRVLWVSRTEGVLQIEDTAGNVWVREL